MDATPGRGMAGLAARLLALLLLAGCAQEMTAAQVELFQPPIVATAASWAGGLSARVDRIPSSGSRVISGPAWRDIRRFAFRCILAPVTTGHSKVPLRPSYPTARLPHKPPVALQSTGLLPLHLR